MNQLENELDKISKERDAQVADFERQYNAMKAGVEKMISDIAALDDQYNDNIKQFFAMLKQYSRHIYNLIDLIL